MLVHLSVFCPNNKEYQDIHLGETSMAVGVHYCPQSLYLLQLTAYSTGREFIMYLS